MNGAATRSASHEAMSREAIVTWEVELYWRRQAESSLAAAEVISIVPNSRTPPECRVATRCHRTEANQAGFEFGTVLSALPDSPAAWARLPAIDPCSRRIERLKPNRQIRVGESPAEKFEVEWLVSRSRIVEQLRRRFHT